jgi:hypothetical protein
MGSFSVRPHLKGHVTHPHFKRLTSLLTLLDKCPPLSTQALYRQIFFGLATPQPLVFVLHLTI